MLNEGELEAMRETVEGSLPDTCTIKRKAVTDDGQGGQTEAWSDLATGVACRLSPLSSQIDNEGEVEDRVATTKFRLVTLPASQDIKVEDRVIVGGQTLEVRGLRDPRSWQLSRRVECLEVT